MSIDIDQKAECLEGNSCARSSGSLYLIVGVGDEVIAALDPVEAKYWILHLSDDIFATIEAWHAAPKAADFSLCIRAYGSKGGSD